MSKENRKLENLKGRQWRKGHSGNLNGRPKGKARKTQLRDLIKNLASLYTDLSYREKAMAYSIYSIAINDLVNIENINSEISHLYFIESEVGIKIGKSKNVLNRLKQIQSYAPSAKILKSIDYAGGFEARLHGKFKHINIEGNKEIGIEWFYKRNELLEFIDEVSSINDLVFLFGGKEYGQLLLFKR